MKSLCQEAPWGPLQEQAERSEVFEKASHQPMGHCSPSGSSPTGIYPTNCPKKPRIAQCPGQAPEWWLPPREGWTSSLWNKGFHWTKLRNDWRLQELQHEDGLSCFECNTESSMGHMQPGEVLDYSKILTRMSGRTFNGEAK